MKKVALFTITTAAILAFTGSFFCRSAAAAEKQSGQYDSYCRSRYLDGIGDINRRQKISINSIENPIYCTFENDQDALNKVFLGNWTALPMKWNVIPPVFNLFSKILFNSDLCKNAIAARKDKAILHFAGRYKPWEFELHKGFNDAYYFYLQKTKFANVKMPQPGKNMKGKSITRQMVRLRIADFWQGLLG